MRKSQYVLFFMNMFSGMAYSIIAPLFPIVSDRHGVTEEILGYIISICAFSSFCISPLVPQIIKKFGRIRVLYISTFIEATCVIIYGFFNFLPSYNSFVLISFIIRTVHGLFCGIVSIIAYSLISSISTEDEIQIALGNMEISWCIGLSAGPLFASIFYEIGGFTLPFIALGSLLYISVYLTKIISAEKVNVEEEEGEEKEEISFFKSIFHLNIIINIGIVTLCIISTTYYFPCLTNHLTQNYNLSISVSSLFFIVGMVFYMIFLRFLNAITDKFGMEKTPCLGLLMIIIGCLFVYPVEPIPQSIVSILIGLCLIGGSGAPINVPALINMSTYLKEYDPLLDELTANDIASTLYSLANNIGDFVGPTLGGFLSSKFGFKSCCVILSFLFLFYLIIYYLIIRSSELKEEIKEDNSNKGKEEINKTISSIDNQNIFDKSFSVFGRLSNFSGGHSFLIRRKFSFVHKKTNKLNKTLISNLTY